MTKKPSRIYTGLSEEEFVKLLQVKPMKKHHKLIFILAYGAGLRISEITSLQPEDVDFSLKRIHIRQGKGSKDRIVNIPKWFRESHLALLPIKISTRAIQIAFNTKSIKAGINHPIGSYTRAGKESTIYKYHFHCLRHSYAERALANGVPIHYLQSMLGHSNISTTNRYTKANPVDAIQSIIDHGV